jgi:hypothetical protein
MHPLKDLKFLRLNFKIPRYCRSQKFSLFFIWPKQIEPRYPKARGSTITTQPYTHIEKI